MKMIWKHIVYQYLFTAAYMLMTAIWQFSTGDAVIFPDRLDWICSTRASDPPSNCLFSQCILWFIYFVIVQSACFALLLLIHHVKAEYCCRKSREITLNSS